MNSGGEWPFHQPRDCAVLTTREVMNGIEPILTVYHDEGESGWQFMGASGESQSNGCGISLEEVVALDPSVLEVADLPPGWFGSRADVNSVWGRHRKPRLLDDDPWGLDPGVTPKSIGGFVFEAVARLFRSK